MSLLFVNPVWAGKIILSFDDAPRASSYLKGMERTKRLIEGLKKAGVEEAVFYCNPGRNLVDWQKRLALYGSAGHVLANHTSTHPRLSDVPAAFYIQNIAEADRLLQPLPGYQKWFRYPYLDESRTDKEKHDAVKNYLVKKGYRLGYVTIENYDWHVESRLQDAIREGKKIHWEKLKALYLKVIRETTLFYEALGKRVLGYSPAHVMLLHENDMNALYIVDIVSMLQEEGFEIVKAHKAFEDPIADSKWDRFPYSQRRIRLIAVESGYTGRVIPEWADTGNLDRLIHDSGVFEN